jgi:hypothetical protein
MKGRIGLLAKNAIIAKKTNESIISSEMGTKSKFAH